MSPKNMMKYLSPVALAASLYSAPVQAEECGNKQDIHTEEELIEHLKCSNENYFLRHPDDPRKSDWLKSKELMAIGEKVVVSQYSDGGTYFGLDSWGQVLDQKHQQLSTKNGKLDLSERIPNYSIPYEAGTKPVDGHYRFDGFPQLEGLEADTLNISVPTVMWPVPGPEKEVSAGEISVGAGYLHIFTQPDETYGFDGQLFGGKAWMHFQPRTTNWYFGPEVMVYGNSSSTEQSVEVPAADGPLAGQLVMKGTAQRSLFNLGFGAGFTGGYMIPFGQDFGLGLELHSGFMFDFVSRELVENSANYVNGVQLEGSNISNTTGSLEEKASVYNGIGAKLNLGGFCLVPAVGAVTNFSQIAPMYSVSLGYCPNQELQE